MSYEAGSPEFERVKDVAARLGEEWENVQILVSRVTEDRTGTDFIQWGQGNIMARERHAQIFLEGEYPGVEA
jgi:hypothetical protein